MMEDVLLRVGNQILPHHKLDDENNIIENEDDSRLFHTLVKAGISFEDALRDSLKRTDEHQDRVSKNFLNKQNIQKSDNDRFIGANALSMTRVSDANENDMLDFKYLRNNKEDYLVCAKSDGMRYLLFVCNNGRVYFNDRKSQYFEVKCFVPPFFNRFVPGDGGSKLIVEYIFDGECVLNKKEAERMKKDPSYVPELQFLAFDTLVYKQLSNPLLKYEMRLKLIDEFQNKFRFYERFFEKERSEYFSLPELKNIPRIEFILKDFYECSKLDFLMTQIIEKDLLPHENDGLIFTKNNYPYLPGRNNGILKWKPNHLNTVDFFVVQNEKLSKKHENLQADDNFFIFELYSIYGNNLFFIDFMFIFNQEMFFELCGSTREYKELGVKGTIYECRYNHELISREMEKFLDDEFNLGLEFSSETVEKITSDCYVAQNWKSKHPDQKIPEPPNEYLDAFIYMVNRKTQGEHKYMVGGWEPIKSRKDKEFPNNFATAYSTIKSIFDSNISRDELLEAMRPDPEEAHKKMKK